MNEMAIKVIVTEESKDISVNISIEGIASAKGIIHAVSQFLFAIKEGTNLAIVTDGIEEFCERHGKDDK